MRKIFPSSKKGIAPTIAIILLLFMTVSAAGTAFYWLHLIDGQLNAEEQANVKKIGPLEGQIKIVAANYREGSDNLVLFLKNHTTWDCRVHQFIGPCH